MMKHIIYKKKSVSERKCSNTIISTMFKNTLYKNMYQYFGKKKKMYQRYILGLIEPFGLFI